MLIWLLPQGAWVCMKTASLATNTESTVRTSSMLPNLKHRTFFLWIGCILCCFVFTNLHFLESAVCGRLHLLRSSRGSLPPDSGGRRYVARGLERGELPVWPRTFGEHTDQLGTQTDSDCTSGRTGLQRGALNSIYINIYIFLKRFLTSS